jgi:hypothetical protein
MIDSILILSTKYWVIAGLTRNLLVTRTLHESWGLPKPALLWLRAGSCCGVLDMGCAGNALTIRAKNWRRLAMSKANPNNPWRI